MHRIATGVFSFASGNRVTVNDDRWWTVQRKLLSFVLTTDCSKNVKAQHASYKRIPVFAFSL